jgi:hypothetical protein
MEIHIEKKEQDKNEQSNIPEADVVNEVGRENLSDEGVSINFTNVKKDENQQETINVMDEDYMSKVVREKTSSTNNQKNQESKKEESDDSKSNYENTDTPELDFEYDSFAEFIIEALDFGASKAAMLIAKEENSSHFEVERKKKERLSKMLTKILEKNNWAISTEVLFAITAIMIFRSPFEKAFKVRKEKAKIEKEKLEKKENENRQGSGSKRSENRGSDTEIEDVVIVEESTTK